MPDILPVSTITSPSNKLSNSSSTQYRNVYINNPLENSTYNYTSNFVITSKYTIYTFLPKFLFETFRKIANLYFLIISILQCVPQISSTSGLPATLPTLVFIVMVDAVFAILEDRKRHIADEIANSRNVSVFNKTDNKFINKKWKDIIVGDIIKIYNRDMIPADLLILSVSTGGNDTIDTNGICYLETKSLDGETNLKLRQAMETTMNKCNTLAELSSLYGKVECEIPNNSINKFTGILYIYSSCNTNDSLSNMSSLKPTCSVNNSSIIKESIPLKSVLLRGCILRNTDWVYGLVLNTGKDTKIMMSATATPSKMSTMDKSINGYIGSLVVLLFIFCIVGATLSVVWNKQYADVSWYLEYWKPSLVIELIRMTFYYFLLMYQFIPISLYVSMSMVKYIQAQFMQWDIGMYNEETDTPALVRTMNLNEELGQISYLFSDKTGTLTCNIMEFRKCSINGVSYGHGTTEIGLAAKEREKEHEERYERSNSLANNTGSNGLNSLRMKNKISICDIENGNIDNAGYNKDNINNIRKSSGMNGNNDDDKNSNIKNVLSSGITTCKIKVEPKTGTYKYVNFDSPEIFSALSGEYGKDESNKIKQFLYHLSICHTVIPEHLDNNSDEVTLSASSPDEQALVAWASYMGYEFIDRTPGFAHIRTNRSTIEKFEILDVLEFSSKRKRMSVVVKNKDDEIFVYTKGADTMVLSRLKQPNVESSAALCLEDGTKDIEYLKEETIKHINQYANEGLRTLTIAMRKLDAQYYSDWAQRYHEALSDIAEIEKMKIDLPNKIDNCMDEIEDNLELLGATAIEDKLQEDVPYTIATLAAAGIKIWILTGDKEETAINVGFACRLLDRNMKQIIISSQRCNNVETVYRELKSQIQSRLTEIWDSQCFSGISSPSHNSNPSNSTNNNERKKIQELALIIDGEALEIALGEKCYELLLCLVQFCKAVIACRVSPAQKAEMVRLIRQNIPNIRTLAIGDGANDVSMIQQAHIGVGISGQEGLQAVNSSDYAIARFKFLLRLLLVHGRWNYSRMSRLVVYMFYKNILLSVAQYWYIFYTGYSGQKFFLEAGVQLYNIAFTALPIVILAVYDKDISDKYAVKYPQLYSPGPLDGMLNRNIFWLWIFGAIFESLGMTLITVYAFIDGGGNSDELVDIWMIGCIVFTLVIIIVNFKLALNQYGWSYFHYIIYIISILAWILVALLASYVVLIGQYTWYRMITHTLSLPIVWILLLFAPITCLLPTFIIQSCKSIFYPEYHHLAREVENLNLDQYSLKLQDSNTFINYPVPYGFNSYNYRRTRGSGISTTGVKPTKTKLTDKFFNKSWAKPGSSHHNMGGSIRRSFLSGFAYSADPSTQRMEAAIATSRSSIRIGSRRNLLKIDN